MVLAAFKMVANGFTSIVANSAYAGLTRIEAVRVFLVFDRVLQACC
jgi:hypothetical protein